MGDTERVRDGSRHTEKKHGRRPGRKRRKRKNQRRKRVGSEHPAGIWAQLIRARRGSPSAPPFCWMTRAGVKAQVGWRTKRR